MEPGCGWGSQRVPALPHARPNHESPSWCRSRIKVYTWGSKGKFPARTLRIRTCPGSIFPDNWERSTLFLSGHWTCLAQDKHRIPHGFSRRRVQCETRSTCSTSSKRVTADGFVRPEMDLVSISLDMSSAKCLVSGLRSAGLQRI